MSFPPDFYKSQIHKTPMSDASKGDNSIYQGQKLTKDHRENMQRIPNLSFAHIHIMKISLPSNCLAPSYFTQFSDPLIQCRHWIDTIHLGKRAFQEVEFPARWSLKSKTSVSDCSSQRQTSRCLKHFQSHQYPFRQFQAWSSILQTNDDLQPTLLSVVRAWLWRILPIRQAFI